jgi:hypothetical protein
MTERRDFDTRLAEAMKAHAAAADRAFDPSAIAHGVLESSRGGRFFGRLMPQPMVLNTGLRIALGLLLLATLLVSMAVAGSRLLESRLIDAGPTPTPTATPTPMPTPFVAEPTKSVLPSEVTSVETSIGTWTWTRFDGDPTTLAEISRREFAAARGDTAAAPATLPDAACADIPFPQIEGLEWHDHCDAERVAGDGTTTVAPVSIGGTFNWASIYGPEAGEPRPGRETGTLRVGDAELIAVFDLESDPRAVEFRDHETSELLLRLEATDPALTPELLAGDAVWWYTWEVNVWMLYVDDGQGAWVEPPWQGMRLSMLDVAYADGQFVAVALDPAGWYEEWRSTLLHSWSSPDGLVWEELAQPIDLERAVSGLDFVGDGDGLMLVLDAGSGPDQTLVWTSTDGVGWHDLELGIRSPGDLSRTGFGWAYLSFPGATCDFWVSADGLDWEQILPTLVLEDPDLARIGTTAGTSCWLVGDVVLALSEYETSGSFWVGRFSE